MYIRGVNTIMATRINRFRPKLSVNCYFSTFSQLTFRPCFLNIKGERSCQI